MKNVCIISLGWLGTALYKALEEKGFSASGSYNSESKHLAHEFQFDINTPSSNNYITEADNLIINLPPSKVDNDNTFMHFLDHYSDKKIIFISSTSVYGDQGLVNEKTIPEPITSNGKRLLLIENHIKSTFKNYQIIRSAGQIGPGRHPGRILSGRVDIPAGNAPVNIIDQKNLIDITYKALLLNDSRVINAVNSSHPTKRDFYTQYCQQHELPLPKFQDESNSNFKTVNTIHNEFEINSNLN